jgi:hypothetical protein
MTVADTSTDSPTLDRYEQLRDHLEYWRTRIAPEWDLLLMKEPPDEETRRESRAVIQSSTDYHQACLWIDERFVEQGDWPEIEVTIAHELLHLVTREYRCAADILMSEVSSRQWSTFRQISGSAEERLVDRCARVMVAERRSHREAAPPRRGRIALGKDWLIDDED